MTSRPTFWRHLRLVRGSGHERLAGKASGSAGAAPQPRRRSLQSPFGAAGSTAAALVAVACAFGPMPDQSTMLDATGDISGAGAPRKALDNFLSDSRRYLGL